LRLVFGVRLPSAFPIVRVAAVEIAVHWRWVAALSLTTVLLAGSVLPERFPAWDTPTLWLTSVGVVLAGEAMLLLHELSHALVARGRGQEVQRIIFHGFVAETVLCDSGGLPLPRHEMLIALVGPGTNLVLAGLLAGLRVVLPAQSPASWLALLLILGNAAMATASLVPLGPSDGGRALSAFRRTRNAGCQ
jgi:Zn-dependent protease